MNGHQPTQSPSPDRDPVIGSLLDLTEPLAHETSFWAELDASLDAVDAEATTRGPMTAPPGIEIVAPIPMDDPTAQSRGASNVIQGPWFRRHAAMLSAAAAAIVICLVAAGTLINREGPGNTVIVDPPTVSEESSEPGTEPATVDDVSSDPNAPEPTALPTIEVASPTVSESPTATQQIPATGSTFETAAPLADGGWIIGVGYAAGLSPDGSAALVKAPSPFGGLGCEAAPITELWRIPFDGSAPSLAAEPGSTINLARFHTWGDRAAWTVGCDGYVTSVDIASISPDGRITNIEAINMADHVSFDPNAGFLGINGISFEDDGRLRVKVANGDAGEILHFSNSELVERTPTTNFEWEPPPGIANDQVELSTRFEGSGLVVATPTGPTSDFVFEGRGVDPSLDMTTKWFLAIAPDFSGGWHALDIGSPAGDCAAALQFVPFDGSAPGAGTPFPGAPQNLDLRIDPATGDAQVNTTCGGATMIFVGTTEDLRTGAPFSPGSPSLWWTSPQITSVTDDAVVFESSVFGPVDAGVVGTFDRSTGETSVTAYETEQGLRIFNGRFRFTVEAQAGWTVGPPPSNGDGWVLTHNSGAEVRVFGTLDRDSALARLGEFDAVISEETINLNTLSMGDEHPATKRRIDSSLSGVPAELTEVVIAAADRAVILEATVPLDNDAARAAVEAIIPTLDVHAPPSDG